MKRFEIALWLVCEREIKGKQSEIGTCAGRGSGAAPLIRPSAALIHRRDNLRFFVAAALHSIGDCAGGQCCLPRWRRVVDEHVTQNCDANISIKRDRSRSFALGDMDRLVNSVANERRIANIENCFRGGVKLQEKGRVLVGEGVLVKMCRKKSKPRQFFLFNDILVYGNIMFNKKKYNNQRIIPLEDVSLDDLPDDGESKNGWIIKTRAKSFAVYAATPTEKTEWMQHIDRCVQDLIKRGGKVAATEHAAVWIPDSEADNCMCCYSARFSVLQRRHHCRACGNVVCGSCSTHNLIVNGVSKRPVRVCDTCYEKSTLESAQKATTSLTVTAAPVQHGNDSSESDEEDVKTGESAQTGDDIYAPPTFYRGENGTPSKTSP
ncbi:hypothetical protein QR680_002681 [Steinernema hermaphroditum]|uniref:FYVE-type domain-containing protein n=1 Tax=Steinernema hermaphroditum TaxID=289476 RepID=A0AA39LIK3_9BILA|nr:hypothetical protein QR680_002681 [Steinernema hermaphroditum]